MRKQRVGTRTCGKARKNLILIYGSRSIHMQTLETMYALLKVQIIYTKENAACVENVDDFL